MSSKINDKTGGAMSKKKDRWNDLETKSRDRRIIGIGIGGFIIFGALILALGIPSGLLFTNNPQYEEVIVLSMIVGGIGFAMVADSWYNLSKGI